jgi:hypothetical protein
MQKTIPLFAILATSILGIYYPILLPYLALMTFWLLIFLLIKQRNQGFVPQSKPYKELEKVKKRRAKVEKNKHKHVNDQITYISTEWGYTKEQEKTIAKFVDQRAYSEMYNKLTASLFPQIITLIDNCNARGQKGCKREVSRRLRELTDLMKEEMKKKKSERLESFETTLEVYDQLLKEVK